MTQVPHTVLQQTGLLNARFALSQKVHVRYLNNPVSQFSGGRMLQDAFVTV